MRSVVNPIVTGPHEMGCGVRPRETSAVTKLREKTGEAEISGRGTAVALMETVRRDVARYRREKWYEDNQ